MKHFNLIKELCRVWDALVGVSISTEMANITEVKQILLHEIAKIS